MSRRAAPFFPLLTASLVLVAGSASAQQSLIENLKTILDTNVSSVETTITDASGVVTRTTTNNFFPRLTLSTDSLLYPSLRLNASGMFEVNMSSSRLNGSDADSTLTRIRPFVELRGTNPLLSPGIGYFRREERARTAGAPGLTFVNEDYAAYLGWKPAGGPQSDLQFVRTNMFDGRRAFQDSSKNFGSMQSRYIYRALDVYYQGSFLDTTDRIHGLETHQVSNSARLDYSKSLLEKRLLWNTTYHINHQNLSTAGSGEGGDVALPVIPFAGLALISDTPGSATLSQSPLLIDGNLTAAAGINLGLPGLGGDSRARNIGLDFVTPTEVDRLLIWVDRELPSDIARSFSWEIYSSTDNLTWRRETTAGAARFGPFENRFQLDFHSVTARYLKVVTRPLSGALIDSPRFPDIFVTEVQPFLTASAAEARKLVQTNQILSTDVRLRLLDTPSLYYEGSYWYTSVYAASQKRDILSNGVSVNHRFGRMVSTYARGAREQGTQAEGRRVATLTDATLTVEPIRTFRGSLLYTGRNERIDDTPSDRQGLLIQTNTQVYRGIDLQFGGGWTRNKRETGEILHDRILNVTASIVPRQNISMTFNYAGTTTRRSGTFSGSPQYHTNRGYLTLAVDPIRTLHLAVAEEVLAVSGEKTRTTHNIGANWAPFPGGSLQFIFAYNEALRPLEFGTERTLRPGVRWSFSRQSYIDVTYQKIASKLVSQTTDSTILSADVRLLF